METPLFVYLESQLNITSVLLKKVILEADSETWSRIRRHYLPTEYHKIYDFINKSYEDTCNLPSFDILKLSIRNNLLLDKVFLIEAAESVDIDNNQLLEFLKNEYTQEEIIVQISKYLEESVMMESAKENVEKLQEIVFSIEEKVDMKDPSEDMSKIELFASDEELSTAVALGLNTDYDNKIKFFPGEYVLIGGVRGSGKSIVAANIAVSLYNRGFSSMYFTIEMPSRSILQRQCAIATGVSYNKIKNRNLSHGEWLTVAKWWSERFEGGAGAFINYTKHNSFDELHRELVTKYKLNPTKQLEVFYDPELTLATIRSELHKKFHLIKPAAIIVDYANQVKRFAGHIGQYDWTEQIEVSKNLKLIAQEYGVPMISPYQIDATGEARFSKGLLDSCDAAYTLNPYNKADNCMGFKCVKMRDADEIDFVSVMDWESLKVGPTNATPPEKKKAAKEGNSKVGEESFDL